MSKNKSSAIETAASPTSWLARHAYLPYLLPLLLLPIYVLRWSLNPDNYFYADDWNWLNYAANSPIREWLHALPTYVYNDRPVGALFIRALYNLFGLNQVAFHAAYLALHLLNVVLAFFLGRILLKSDKAAFCSVLLFGCWGSALQAPMWVAAIFDLACCTFTLSAILAHLAGKSPWLTALFFIAAIRTKEFAIMIPLLLLADEAIRSTPWNKERIWRVI